MSNRDDMDEGQGRLRSTVNRTDQSGRRVKGRGFGNTKDEEEDRYGGKFDSMEEDETTGPIRSVEGWIVFVTGVHEEATEEIIMDKFNEVGITKNLSLPLDRRTGFVKGYALIEYEKKEQAEKAIKELNGTELMETTIHVDWAFHGKTEGGSRRGNTSNRGGNNRRFTRK
ncbi:RNA-binding protein 8A [Planoprotostelium fungivorum]|uniref:RNA-binding protein 8A n=1 Tax=Planoprotostelium fungivorum TaxID=1890364 RepID=A0A2P6N7Q1_9EUKA|nr:RNA-binding protein 8A [Planoprotostelium fungivorum]